MPQAVKIPAAKAVDKEWEKLVKGKKKVIDEARTAGATVQFASLMDICHLKNAELEAKHHKYKGRVVLCGDIVKDDSVSNAVFTEQRSSAPQLTAAKIMDIKSRFLGWTSSRRSVTLYPSENGRCSQIIENSQNRSVQTFGVVFHDTNGQNHGPVWKTQSFLLKEICTVIFWQDCCGKGNLRTSY